MSTQAYTFVITWGRRLVLALAIVCALALSASGLNAVPPVRATGGCASGGSGPCIEWQANFLLPDGSTYIGGPAGTHVTILGGGFSAADGKKISIGLGKGNDIFGINPAPSPTFRTQSHKSTGATATISGGSFIVSFAWPSGLSTGHWSACAYIASTGMPAGGAAGNTNNAAFNCTSPNRPKLSVSPATILPGTTITVTGQGWLPDMNTIVVEVRTCATCSTYIARYGNAVSSGSAGDFSVRLSIPAAAHLGTYTLWAGASAIPVDTGTTGPHLTVVTSLAPTATPKPSPTATALATATAPPANTPGANSATPSVAPSSNAAPDAAHTSGGGSNSWLFIALGALVVLLGAGAGAGVWYVMRKRQDANGGAR